jgi:hypothetical protein
VRIQITNNKVNTHQEASQTLASGGKKYDVNNDHLTRKMKGVKMVVNFV